MRDELAEAGVDGIMAKHAIRPGADWAETIRKCLEASSALVCVASEGYTKSAWCQQEIGWALGRHLPTLWIRYDADERSVGFLAAKQELVPEDASDHPVIASSVVSWLASEERTRDQTAAALLAAFADSNSFRQTRRIAELIADLGSLTADEWQQVDAAAEANPQISSAVYFDHPKRPPVAEWLRMTMGEIG